MILVNPKTGTNLMPEFLERLKTEYLELTKRIEMLEMLLSFHDTRLSETEEKLARKQKKAMVEYRNVLRKRLDYYGIP